MDILENPLEAVAFRLHSLPDASAWTCLAAALAAAAAAGLWRLRSSAPPVAGAASLKPLELEPSKAKEVFSRETATASASARSSPDSASSTTTAAPSPKERYTAYYRDSVRVGCCGVDDEEGDDDEAEEAEEQDEEDGGSEAYRTLDTTKNDNGPFGWEVVSSLPLSPSQTMAGMGRYRSPTALSGGSVVRLWDDAGATAASPRRRSRVVAAVSAF